MIPVDVFRVLFPSSIGSAVLAARPVSPRSGCIQHGDILLLATNKICRILACYARGVPESILALWVWSTAHRVALRFMQVVKLFCRSVTTWEMVDRVATELFVEARSLGTRKYVRTVYVCKA